ncbi:MAG: cytochrome-c peroxidase [Saprospiraceae bacterium]|nr:cytochrome-c peroxidase [Saprospiraceae bacterium]
MTINTRIYFLFFGLSLTLWACSKIEVPVPEGYTPPPGFPDMVIPAENAFLAERVELGKSLFFDPILSADSTRSCASCHLPAFAFSDTTAFSLGVGNRVGIRNSLHWPMSAIRRPCSERVVCPHWKCRYWFPSRNIWNLIRIYSTWQKKSARYPTTRTWRSRHMDVKWIPGSLRGQLRPSKGPWSVEIPVLINGFTRAIWLRCLLQLSGE